MRAGIGGGGERKNQLQDWKTLPKLQLNALVFIKVKHFKMSARFSDLKVGIRELSFLFMQ